jgi:hypothetical protein
MKLTNEVLAWARDNLTAEQLNELNNQTGVRSHIASNKSDHGKNAGSLVNREVRKEFGIPSGMSIFERAEP